MNATNADTEDDPLRAPWKRKLLAVRVLALGGVSLAALFYAFEWYIGWSHHSEDWRFFLLWAAVGLSTICYLGGFFEGLKDLAAHVMSGSKMTLEDIKAYEESEYLRALVPLFVLIGLVALAGLIGGMGVLRSLWDSMFGDWPNWAVVITFLLVLILLKK